MNIALDHFIQNFEDFAGSQDRIICVVGGIQAGKTTAVCYFADWLRAQTIKVGGIVQPVMLDSSHHPIGYQMKDLSTGKVKPFARRLPHKKGYDFDHQIWPWVAERLAWATRHCDLVVVDELGRLEAKGEGHMPAVKACLQLNTSCRWVFCVRADCLDQIVSQLSEASG